MSAGGERRALPDGVMQSLRETFAAEVATRLPHLRSLRDHEVVLRDVHTLASSALLLGETALGQLARTVEGQLELSPHSADLPALVAALEGFVP